VAVFSRTGRPNSPEYALILNWTSVKRLLARLVRLSAGPFAFDFSAVEAKVERLQDELQSDAASAPQVKVVTEPPPASVGDTDDDPELAKAQLLLLITQVEQEMRRVTERRRQKGDFPSLRVRSRYLPSDIRAVVADLIPLRNSIVHGGGLSQQDVNAAASLAREVLGLLRGLPVVVHSALSLYEDPEATRARSGVVGVQVSTSSQDGQTELRVFPTTRSYEDGAIVALEFDSARRWQASWYRDPKSDEIRPAFEYSVEFTGRVR
jgi:hypothetical protein